MESGPSMNPQEIPPVELLDDILIPLRMIVDRLYWWGFKDGVCLSALIFFILFLFLNKGEKR